jgi:aminoglycoside phosphotransferase (APT) family kinase protein
VLEPGAVVPSTDFRAAAQLAVGQAAELCGLSVLGARLIRLFATAVYHLPETDAVVRVAPVTSIDTVTRLDTSVQVTRWLHDIGFPVVEPLSVDQPVTSHGCVITFWRYLPQRGSAPKPVDLGRLLRRLHRLGPPPVQLPVCQPLRSVRQAIQSSQAINSEEERTWLDDRCGQLQDAYDRLTFALPTGMIHGDAYRGNLLRDGRRIVLADWDAVSNGPREIDLIPTLQATRFGLQAGERDAFIAAYGQDIRAWPGYQVLHDIRELSTTSALLRDAHLDPTRRQELKVRLQTLRVGDNRTWTAF